PPDHPHRHSFPTRRSSDLELPPSEGEDDRFEQLRAWRRIEAQRAQVAPFVIFHDTTLRAMARTNPKTLAELETIPGIGPSKLERDRKSTRLNSSHLVISYA